MFNNFEFGGDFKFKLEVAALTCVLYDMILCFDQEVRLLLNHPLDLCGLTYTSTIALTCLETMVCLLYVL
jgi:hypothetical protein